MFENKSFNRIHYSRFIASWIRCGDGFNPIRFESWLLSIGIPEDVAAEIRYMYETGKTGLEASAKAFCETH